jgi:hypothetical protein
VVVIQIKVGCERVICLALERQLWLYCDVVSYRMAHDTADMSDACPRVPILIATKFKTFGQSIVQP